MRARDRVRGRERGSENCFTELCSGSEVGSCSRLIDFVYHSTLEWRVIKKKRRRRETLASGRVCILASMREASLPGLGCGVWGRLKLQSSHPPA